MNYGFLRVASVVPRVKVADCRFNAEQICNLTELAAKKGAKVIVFPEMSVTAYTCGDLFRQSTLLNAAEQALSRIKDFSKGIDAILFIGMPIKGINGCYNCAVAISQGEVLGVVPKTYLPNYNEFYEKRWFASSVDAVEDFIEIDGKKVPFGNDLLFKCGDVVLAAELCEDVWTPVPPSCASALAGANMIVNLSASNEVTGKHAYLCDLIKQQSARCIAAYIYSSAGNGESSTDLVFAGNAMIVENGILLGHGNRFSIEPSMVMADVDVESINNDRRGSTSFTDSMRNNKVRLDYRTIDFHFSNLDLHLPLLRKLNQFPFVPTDDSALDSRCEEIIDMQTWGLMRRLDAIGCKHVVIGVSGGLDSTLALLVAAKAFDRLNLPREGITGITMPGFGTTGRTYNNALVLMQALGISIKEISIKNAVMEHFSDIGHDASIQDVTYENSQARERTQILMDYSNKVGGIVVGTGDLSELALGWATYNGDHMSMYGVNAGVPKTLVQYLVKWFADRYFVGNDSIVPALLDIVDTPISPELVPASETGEIKQKTEDLVGPYELHDFFLYHMLRHGFTPRKIYMLASETFGSKYDGVTIKKWLSVFVRRFFTQQFKRSCLPDGPKIGSVSLSPRGDWRMPSDAAFSVWMQECESL